MAKTTDWESIKYEFGLYRQTRAFKRHAAIGVGAVVLLIGVLIASWALTSSAPVAAIKKVEAKPRSAVPAELRAPNEFVESLHARLSRDPRYARAIVAVPTLTGDRRATSRVMIQGRVSSDSELEGLRDLVQQLKPPVPIDWQVVIVEKR